MRSTAFLLRCLNNPWVPTSWYAAPYARTTRDEAGTYHGALYDAQDKLLQVCEHDHEKRHQALECATRMRDAHRARS